MVAHANDFRPLSLDERRKHIAKTAEAEQGPRKRPMARERGDGLDVPIDLENLTADELEEQRKKLLAMTASVESVLAQQKIKLETGEGASASTPVIVVPLRFF